jgi:tetratricopeptide (TPR) repeat protein
MHAAFGKLAGYVAVLHCLVAGADGETWRIRGRFIALDEANPLIAVFELEEGGRVLIPLASLADDDRLAVVRLAQPGVPGTGDTVDAEVAAASAARASQRLEHAIELIRIGNGQLARQELKEASKLDGASGAADFVTGLVYVFASRNFEKAADHFREASRREPKNARAVANLAVCEFHDKQYVAATAHFRTALELEPQDQAIVDNIGLVIQAAGSDRVRLPAKVMSDLNDLYRESLTEGKLVPLAQASGRSFRLHGRGGDAVEITAQDGLVKLLTMKPPAANSGDEK